MHAFDGIGRGGLGETKGKFATTAKDIARLHLLQQMRRLASYVNFTADGDANKLVSSGFTLVPPPTANGVPGVPLWVRVRRGAQKGQLNMGCAKVKHTWQYEYQVVTVAKCVALALGVLEAVDGGRRDDRQAGEVRDEVE